MPSTGLTLGVLGALLLSAPAFAAAEPWTLEAEIAIASDYRWRGISLSDEQPSLQVEGTLAHDNGVWLWGNLNTVGQDYGGAEIGLGAGYTRTLGGVEWTIGAVQYLYAGEDGIDYAEADLSAAKAFGPVTLSAGAEYVPEQANYDEDDLYLWLGWEVAGPRGIRLHGHVGQDDGVMAPAPYAIDYSIGAGAPLGGFNLDLSFVDVETEDSAWVLRLAYPS